MQSNLIFLCGAIRVIYFAGKFYVQNATTEETYSIHNTRQAAVNAAILLSEKVD